MSEFEVPVLSGDEGDLFRRHHGALLRAVGRSIDASDELIEDACQSAWTVLLRCQPERTPALFAWLRTVAIHRALRLVRQERRDARLEDLPGDEGWERLIGACWSLELAIEARRALALVAALPPLQRDDLVAVVAGYSYREIATRCEARPRTLGNVNKRLTKARSRIRRLEAAA